MTKVHSQSFEFMLGTERIFIDAQWLKTFDTQRRWSLFSRSRATVDYEEQTNLFTGAYLNYTSKSGFGGTVLGRIATSGAGMDGGIHFFKAKKSFLIYALASIELNSELGYSWFSITRFTPNITEQWKLYTSLELFSNLNKDGHVVSVQRIRAGVDQQGYQFGLALNLTEFGEISRITDRNFGIFLRKEF
ncbi:MAG: hypothetical protein ACPGJS_10570 [Flammeovirgaceae bacterium]